MTNDVADLTGLLQAWSRGDAQALEQLAPLVHLELRGVARRMLSRERQADGWQPTDLVHESYLRLLDWRVVRWQNRAHFFATTARMMRRVLVDSARARRAVKRGGGVDAASLEGLDVAAPEPLVDVLALEEALTALATVDPRPSQVVELRFFGGFSVKRQPKRSACPSALWSMTGTPRAHGFATSSQLEVPDEHRPMAAAVRMAQRLARRQSRRP